MVPSIDEQYDTAKRRKRMADGYRRGSPKPIASRPGHCWTCHTPIVWAKLPDGRWLQLDPDPTPQGRYAALSDQRAYELPLGATTLPEVARHHAHRITCGVQPA